MRAEKHKKRPLVKRNDCPLDEQCLPHGRVIIWPGDSIGSDAVLLGKHHRVSTSYRLPLARKLICEKGSPCKAVYPRIWEGIMIADGRNDLDCRWQEWLVRPLAKSNGLALGREHCCTRAQFEQIQIRWKHTHAHIHTHTYIHTLAGNPPVSVLYCSSTLPGEHGCTG